MRRRTLVYFIIDILVVTAAFLIFIWIKPASKRLYLPNYFQPFLFFLALWILVSFSIDKYRLYKKQSLRDLLFPVLVGDFIIFSTVVFLILLFQQFDYSRMIVFGTMGLSFLLEVFLIYVYYYNRQLSRDAEHFDSFTQTLIKVKAGLMEQEEAKEILENL